MLALTVGPNPFRGCVTPVQIEHLKEESGGDTDMIDGYDELPADLQEKVKFALANGHVPDEDWKGVCLQPSLALIPSNPASGRRG